MGVFPIMEALVETSSCSLNFDIDVLWTCEVSFDDLMFREALPLVLHREYDVAWSCGWVT